MSFLTIKSSLHGKQMPLTTRNARSKTDAFLMSTKLCHIVKRADFNGYGFNLLTDKTKPGQYIGQVDPLSPAEAAGLKEGFRIIQVNGIPIGNENHKQVVKRIKAIPWEVQLLVATECNVFVKPSNKKQPAIDASLNKKNVTAVNDQNIQPKCNTKNESISKEILTNSQQSVTDLNAFPTTSKNTTQSSAALKLPSSVSEMRAILNMQSKRKQNSKSSDINLLKKYEIVEQL